MILDKKCSSPLFSFCQEQKSQCQEKYARRRDQKKVEEEAEQ